MVNMEELAVLARWVLQDNGDYDDVPHYDDDNDGDDDGRATQVNAFLLITM